MRLKQIKLAGFKSFVDPTTVPFPGQMTSIVGPNGCGKSNIIDAVRWVLGESSAKNLRGDAMTDVIFNGSSARKPVSQASIELVFDNTSGRISGEFTSYNEISIKRTVNKDGTSHYLLNNNKCRKKDITELFLGTGLGPRSYAIIEQGMISKLIESKPHELRLFIEEAAGISKYKERRRETEIRIRHTRENLERLDDLIAELANQIDNLKRQAESAKKYKALRADERQFKAELLALNWSEYQSVVDTLDKQIKQQQLNLDKLISEQSVDERLQTEYKQTLAELTTEQEQVNQSQFKLAQEITKIEQQLIFQKVEKTKLNLELDKLNQSLTELTAQVKQQTQQNTEQTDKLSRITPEIEQISLQLDEVEQQLEQGEIEFNQASEAFESNSQQYYQTKNQQQNIQLQAENCRQSITQDTQKLHQLKQQGIELRQVKYSGDIQQITAKSSQEKTRCEELQKHVASTKNQLQVDYQAWCEREQTRDGLRADLQNCHARITSLQTLIENQTQLDDTKLQTWFQQNQIAEYKNLYDDIKIQAGWELAVNTVLKQWPAAYVINQAIGLQLSMPDFELTLFNQGKSQTPVDKVANSLAEKVDAPAAIIQLLNRIEITTEAQNSNPDIFDSMIEQNGHWRSQVWSYFPAKQDNAVLVNKSKLDKAQNQAREIVAALELAETQFLQAKAQHEKTHQLSQKQQNAFVISQQKLDKLADELELANKQMRYQQTQIQANDTETAQLTSRLEDKAQQLEILEDQSEEYTIKLAELADVKALSENNKHSLYEKQKHLRASQNQVKHTLHQLQIQFETTKHQIESIKSNLATNQTRLIELETKQTQTNQALNEVTQPNQSLALTLQQKLGQKTELEDTKVRLLEKIKTVQLSLANLEQGQHSHFGQRQKLQDSISQFQIEQQGFKVKAKGILENLNELNVNLDMLLQQMPVQAEQKTWQHNLDKLSIKIAKLGAINLAAIDEYEHQLQRKEYLDAQKQDLVSAIETLEDAIRKIDKETKAKFKDTYETINQDLKRLFPKVFGGGSAWLELTDNDLLDTGVSIMARPPGKKNSTIHLLSGGEKALTALSLVFAIFRLNPAPFCMLDEVDAPLDDANVARFCNLVREMSSTVQFIYISHNKIAMEMANQLVGVTMQEPGVSRMVAVDIEKAIELAQH
ncbi:chromosome segregation protein SMC [Catenovulum maritimum]|uniref:Chromosome partition protein Smc n=1 Tax=Catenovulum maritimum TaxID=1513271 RepID=A0A0J8GN30_9ALTE|nr:chromosome segregation protein SMC [Catenovulum maritimum]KMT64237.1 hypothetical protein XM47_15265 [Catenovulum maritimum]